MAMAASSVVMVAVMSLETVTLALPSIAHAFGARLDETAWTITAFMISRMVVLGAMGWLDGIFGTRVLLCLSLATFTGGALLSGFAWSIESLIAFRVVQGIGAGPLFPLATVMLYEGVPAREQGRTQSLYLVGDAIGTILGRGLGGYLIDVFGWRMAFHVTVPFGALSLALALAVTPKRRPPEKKPIDVFGLTLLTIGVTSLLICLHYGSRVGFVTPKTLGALVVAALAFLLLVPTERRVRAPLIDLGLFGVREYRLACALGCSRIVGVMSVAFLTPIVLQRLFVYTPLQTGAVLIPAAVISGLGALVGGKLSDTINPRAVVIGGFAFSTLVAAALSATTAAVVGPASFVIFVTLIYGLAAVLFVPLNIVALRALPPALVQMGMSTFYLLQGASWIVAIMTVSVVIDSAQPGIGVGAAPAGYRDCYSALALLYGLSLLGSIGFLRHDVNRNDERRA